MASKKPSESEEEYFVREETEKRRKFVLAETRAMADADRERLRVLHHMRCPKCGMQLTELSLEGARVDRCFGCNGIFLDEDDVKKLIHQEGYWSRMMHFFSGQNYAKDPAK